MRLKEIRYFLFLSLHGLQHTGYSDLYGAVLLCHKQQQQSASERKTSFNENTEHFYGNRNFEAYFILF